MKKYHGYEVDVYHEIFPRTEEEDPCNIVPHYFLEEDAARKFFDSTELKDDVLQVNLYECMICMEGSSVLSVDDEELVDQKY